MESIKLINGSSSLFRQKLLTDAGYNYITYAPEIDERSIRDVDPKKLVVKVGLAKSDAVIAKTGHLGPRIIITSDQVMVLMKKNIEGPILHKPKDRAEAREFLANYEGGFARTHTSMIVWHSGMNRRAVIHDIADLYMSAFSDEELEQMLDDPLVYKACGAIVYGVPGSPAADIVRNHQIKLVGEEASFVGLPLRRLRSALAAFNYTKSLAKAQG